MTWLRVTNEKSNAEKHKHIENTFTLTWYVKTLKIKTGKCHDVDGAASSVQDELA